MAMDPYFEKLFAMGLGLERPWKITDIRMEQARKGNLSIPELHIDIDFEKGATFKIKDEECKAYDSSSKQWRHLNFFQYRCYLNARVPRVQTKDGKIITVDVPWARKGSGFTLLMEAVILSLITHMPVSTVAKEIGEHDTRLWRVLKHHVEEALKEQDFSDVTALGVDEYSHKGHNYITIFLSHPEFHVNEEGKREKTKNGRVLYVAQGKDSNTVKEFVEKFEAKKGSKDSVEVITSDMTHCYKKEMVKNFPQADVTVDKFHVVKNFNEMVDDVRRSEMRSKDKKKYDHLDKTRFLWLKNQEDLTEKQLESLKELSQLDYLDTVKAYDFKLKIQHFYDTHHELDERTICDFEQITLEMASSTVYQVRKMAKTLTTHAIEILNYFKTLRTNSILEGFNSKISIIKNRARGFRNMENFISMIYFVCGELSISRSLTIM